MSLKQLLLHEIYQLVFPGAALQKQYRSFKSLLENDKQAHRLIAELEEIHHSRVHVDIAAIETIYEKLSGCVRQMINDLLSLSPWRHRNLDAYFKKFDDYIRLMLAPPAIDSSPPYIIQPGEISEKDLNLVGGKAFNLANTNSQLGLPVPEGFVITTNAFHLLLEENKIRRPIRDILAELNVSSYPALTEASRKISDLIHHAAIPEIITNQIRDFLTQSLVDSKANNRYAVRSSALGEDSAISFAGQYRSVLNVSADDILTAYKDVIASKYSPRALYYRIYYGLSDAETPMAALVLKMIPARASGIIYTADIQDKKDSSLRIHSVAGIGEILANGSADPDIFRISKTGDHDLLSVKLGTKPLKMVVSAEGYLVTENTPIEERQKVSLDPESVKTLVNWAMQLEKFYGCAQDIEWCQDNDGSLYLLQSRPLVIEKEMDQHRSCQFQVVPDKVLFTGGETASPGIASGKVFNLSQDADLELIGPGTVLVTGNAMPHYVAVMDKLKAVVTDQGSKASHFASVAREFGIPVLVNTGDASSYLKNGMEVTLHAERKQIFEGLIASDQEQPSSSESQFENNPFKRRMKFTISFISPLQLTDPRSPSFHPEGCRSLHDIVRYSHEMALREMFNIGDKRSSRIRNAKMLKTQIPISFFVLDLGKGLTWDADAGKQVSLEQVSCSPMRSLFKGLMHPDIHWSGFSHFNWEEFDNIVMSGGVANKNSIDLASFAMISNDYLNLNLRFGYHFVIVDCHQTEDPGKNHLMFRFTGGGGTPEGRVLRTRFLNAILQRLGFRVEIRGELVEAQLIEINANQMEHTLDMLGRLLGATRLMDMYLKDVSMTDQAVEQFFNGRYDFAAVES